jgi:large subunit ribosomal protein L21
MYAVIKTGGKQHKVKAGDVLEIELTHTDGDTITFTPLLVVDDDGGTHYGKEAAKAVVTAKLLGEKKGEKVKIFKYKSKTGYSKRQGHRQLYTLIEISDVSLGARRSTKKAEPKKEEPTPVAEAAPADDAPQPEEVGAVTKAEEPETHDDAPADRTEEAADAGAPEA